VLEQLIEVAFDRGSDRVSDALVPLAPLAALAALAPAGPLCLALPFTEGNPYLRCA
jgi:hypothetical protein